QYNGGFSDFNSFGFFSGFMFLWATDHIMEKRVTGFLTLMAALLGIILSGSRAAFFFILAALINLFFKLKVRHKKKIIVIILVFIFLMIVVAGGTFKERLVGSFSQSDNLFDTLNKLSNGRLWMSRFSLQTIKDFYLTGIGLGNFTFYLKYKNFNQYYVYDLTLNQYLQVFTETGFWGFLFFTFFLIFLLLKSSKKLFMGTILFVLLLNNYFWFPEILIIFWLIGALFYNERKIQIKSKIPFFRFMIWLAILSVIVGNIFVFSHLHPKNWAVEKGVYYDYGFWYPERDHQGRIFKWTRHKSGIYTCLDQKGESSSFYILCSAPLEHLPGKVQKVFVYWRGEKYNTITFRHNCSETFKIKGKPFQSGFLELRIEPTFCLKELNLGEEKRHLGVQFYVNSF
ncbi:MAG: O-antigen ligase family protein, partial [Candidatus Aminicenantes bacterium]|nr:O-antigen ligase family protein [Candidatus Aminicenantes bacterium]